jgi:hypothetical protein
MAGGTARARKQEPAQADGDDDGILRIGESAEEPKYDTLFKIDGKPYTALVNPPGNVFHKYIDTIRKRGPNFALSWLLERMLAPEAYAALMDSPKVTDADITAVTDLCTGLITGRTVAPKARA